MIVSLALASLLFTLDAPVDAAPSRPDPASPSLAWGAAEWGVGVGGALVTLLGTSALLVGVQAPSPLVNPGVFAVVSILPALAGTAAAWGLASWRSGKAVDPWPALGFALLAEVLVVVASQVVLHSRPITPAIESAASIGVLLGGSVLLPALGAAIGLQLMPVVLPGGGGAGLVMRFG